MGQMCKPPRKKGNGPFLLPNTIPTYKSLGCPPLALTPSCSHLDSAWPASYS